MDPPDVSTADRKQYHCIYPCYSSFDTARKLAQHYSNRPQCKQNWKRYHDNVARAAYEKIVHNDIALEQADPAELEDDTAAISAFSAASDLDGQMDCVSATSSVSDQPLWAVHTASPDQSFQDPFQEVPPALNQGFHADDHIEPILDFDDLNGSDASVEQLAAEFDAWWFNETQPETPVVDNSLDETIESDSKEGSTSSEQSEPMAIDNIQDQIEDSPDDDETEVPEDLPVDIEEYEGAGEIKATGTPHFARLMKRQRDKGNGNSYFPFESAAEFEMVSWLNDLPLSKIDSFLHTKFVRLFSFYG
jgi:hypothetical protein